MFNPSYKGIVMKKMLLVVALAAAVVSIADARCGRRNNSCATKCETQCAPKCETQQKCCIPSPVIVDCVTNVCEGEIPQLCSLKPARVNAVKHVDTNIYYSCAERGPCEVIPTQAQVDALIGMGAVPADTVPCSR